MDKTKKPSTTNLFDKQIDDAKSGWQIKIIKKTDKPTPNK